MRPKPPATPTARRRLRSFHTPPVRLNSFRHAGVLKPKQDDSPRELHTADSVEDETPQRR